jgi:GTP-dependent phosphoenolpyruvate carboxykinase
METQIKFLNKQYLETRLREIREIKRKEIKFEIEESDRAFSKTLYVNFFCLGIDNKWFKNHTLRISDHSFADCPHTQFIIEPNEYMTKKKKQQFIKSIELAIRKAKSRSFRLEMRNISRENKK